MMQHSKSSLNPCGGSVCGTPRRAVRRGQFTGLLALAAALPLAIAPQPAVGGETLTWYGSSVAELNPPSFGNLYGGNIISPTSINWEGGSSWKKDNGNTPTFAPGPGDTARFSIHGNLEDLDPYLRNDRVIERLEFNTQALFAIQGLNSDGNLVVLQIDSGVISRTDYSLGQQTIYGSIVTNGTLNLELDGTGGIEQLGGVKADRIVKTGTADAGLHAVTDARGTPQLTTAREVNVNRGSLSIGVEIPNLETVTVGDGNFSTGIEELIFTDRAVLKTDVAIFAAKGSRLIFDGALGGSLINPVTVLEGTVLDTGDNVLRTTRINATAVRNTKVGGIEQSFLSQSGGYVEPTVSGIKVVTVDVTDGGLSGPDLLTTANFRGYGDTKLDEVRFVGDGTTRFAASSFSSPDDYQSIKNRVGTFRVDSGTVEIATNGTLGDRVVIGRNGLAPVGPATLRLDGPYFPSNNINDDAAIDIYDTGTLAFGSGNILEQVGPITFHGSGAITSDASYLGFVPNSPTTVLETVTGIALFDANVALPGRGLPSEHTLDVRGTGPQVRLNMAGRVEEGTLIKAGTGAALFTSENIANLRVDDGTAYIRGTLGTLNAAGGRTELRGGTNLNVTGAITVGTPGRSIGATLVFQADNPVAADQALTLHGGTVDLNGYDQTFTAIHGTGRNSVSTGAGILTVNNITADGGVTSVDGKLRTRFGGQSIELGSTNAGLVELSGDLGPANVRVTANSSAALLNVTSTGFVNTEAGSQLRVLSGQFRDLAGSGALTLQGNNVLSSTMNAGFDGSIAVSGGTSDLGVRRYSVGPLTLDLGAKVNGGTLVLQGSETRSGFSGGTINADLDLGGATHRFTVDSSTLRLNGDVANGKLSKEGLGTLRLYGNNTYAGGTSLDAGTLAIDSGGALGTGRITAAGGTTLQILDDLTLANRVILDAGLLTFDTNGHTLQTDGSIMGFVPTSGIAKAGGGTLIATGNINYAGGTVVDGGTLALRGPTPSVESSSGVSVASGATFDLSGAANSNTVRGLTGGGTVALGDNTLVFDATATNTFAGSITDGGLSGGTGGGLTKRGANLTLSGTQTYTGATRVEAGALRLTNANTGIGNSSGVFLADGTTLDIADTANGVTLQALTGGGTVLTGNRTVRLNIADGADITFGGNISGNGALVKRGAGTLTLALTGGTTYSGDTTLTGGTLVAANVTGSATGSGDVLIDGGTLAGTGRIDPGFGSASGLLFGRDVTLNAGSIAPGNSPGTLTFAFEDGFGSTLNLDGGSLDFELGIDSDLIRFEQLGDFLRGTGTTLELSLLEGFSYANTYTLFDNVLESNTFSFADVTGISPGYQANVFHNGTLNAYQISFAAVPEPTTLAMLGLGGMILATRRRRVA